MIKLLLVEDDLSLSNSIFDFWMILLMSHKFLMAMKAYMKPKVAFTIWFYLTLCCQKNGFQVLKELREKDIKIPVLIMTAKESLDDKGHGFELGADDYLTKPFTWGTQDANSSPVKTYGEIHG